MRAGPSLRHVASPTTWKVTCCARAAALNSNPGAHASRSLISGPAWLLRLSWRSSALRQIPGWTKQTRHHRWMNCARVRLEPWRASGIVPQRCPAWCRACRQQKVSAWWHRLHYCSKGPRRPWRPAHSVPGLPCPAWPAARPGRRPGLGPGRRGPRCWPAPARPGQPRHRRLEPPGPLFRRLRSPPHQGGLPAARHRQHFVRLARTLVPFVTAPSPPAGRA